MMNAKWIFNPAEFEAKSFEPIPAGAHRVRINDVIFKRFNSGNEGYEITLDVSGYGSKLWYYLVLDPSDTKKTNQRIGSFFDSFGITDFDMNHFMNWKGKVGAVRVKHEPYNGENQAKVAFVISRKEQDKLPAANFSDATSVAANTFGTVEIDDSDLPFGM